MMPVGPAVRDWAPWCFAADHPILKRQLALRARTAVPTAAYRMELHIWKVAAIACATNTRSRTWEVPRYGNAYAKSLISRLAVALSKASQSNLHEDCDRIGFQRQRSVVPFIAFSEHHECLPLQPRGLNHSKRVLKQTRLRMQECCRRLLYYTT